MRLAPDRWSRGHAPGAPWAPPADRASPDGLDPVATAFQPVLLASLASSTLPVSNLTNLIVAEPAVVVTGLAPTALPR